MRVIIVAVRDEPDVAREKFGEWIASYRKRLASELNTKSLLILVAPNEVNTQVQEAVSEAVSSSAISAVSEDKRRDMDTIV